MSFSTLEARELPNFSDLAEKSSPAVVNITSSRTVKERNAYGRGFGDPRYDEFFGDFLDSNLGHLHPEKILGRLYQQVWLYYF